MASVQTMPGTPEALARTAEQCRRLVKRRALLAAGVAMVPVPGLDWLTDIGVLVKLLPEISQAFGLSEAQIERLAPERRLVVYKAISTGGAMVLGRVVTAQVVMSVLKTVGVKLTTQQAAKYVPVAGQAVSAALTYSALKYVCELHIRQCEAVAGQLVLPAPAGRQGAQSGVKIGARQGTADADDGVVDVVAHTVDPKPRGAG